jgi:hypothetical protein
MENNKYYNALAVAMEVPIQLAWRHQPDSVESWWNLECAHYCSQ